MVTPTKTIKAPTACCTFSFSFKKQQLAIKIKTRDNRVAKVVIEVDAPANLGILSNELLIMMKLILVKTAETMANINFQLKSSRVIFSKFNKFPEIKDLSPNNTIESVFVIQ